MSYHCLDVLDFKQIRIIDLSNAYFVMIGISDYYTIDIKFCPPQNGTGAYVASKTNVFFKKTTSLFHLSAIGQAAIPLGNHIPYLRGV